MINYIRPSYFPESLFDIIVLELSDKENFLNELIVSNENGSLSSIIPTYRDQISYLRNLIADSLILKDVFVENEGNMLLFDKVYRVFKALASWDHNTKTSGKEDYRLAVKMRKNLCDIKNALPKSIDIWINLQMHWQERISKIILEAHSNDITEAGQNILKLANRLVLDNPLDRQKMKDLGIIKKGEFENPPFLLGFEQMLDHMVENLDCFIPAASEKDNGVIKFRAENAAMHYAVKQLKEAMVKYNVPKLRHVRHIQALILGVMKEDVSEDSIRKLIR